MDTISFRGICRGTDKNGRRVRRVRVIEAPTYETAWASFGDVHAEMAKGLKDPFYNLLPPVGIKLDGTASVGFEIAP